MNNLSSYSCFTLPLFSGLRVPLRVANTCWWANRRQSLAHFNIHSRHSFWGTFYHPGTHSSHSDVTEGGCGRCSCRHHPWLPELLLKKKKFFFFRLQSGNLLKLLFNLYQSTCALSWFARCLTVITCNSFFNVHLPVVCKCELPKWVSM